MARFTTYARLLALPLLVTQLNLSVAKAELLCDDDLVAGAVGGTAGGVAGNLLSGRGHRTSGTLWGALAGVFGGIVLNKLTKPTSGCAPRTVNAEEYGIHERWAPGRVCKIMRIETDDPYTGRRYRSRVRRCFDRITMDEMAAEADEMRSRGLYIEDMQQSDMQPGEEYGMPGDELPPPQQLPQMSQRAVRGWLSDSDVQRYISATYTDDYALVNMRQLAEYLRRERVIMQEYQLQTLLSSLRFGASRAQAERMLRPFVAQ